VPGSTRSLTDRLQLILDMPWLSITEMESGPLAAWTTCSWKASAALGCLRSYGGTGAATRCVMWAFNG
jgi:hypothetical protein